NRHQQMKKKRGDDVRDGSAEERGQQNQETPDEIRQDDERFRARPLNERRPKRRKQQADGERRRQNPDLKFGRSLPDRHRDVKLVDDQVEHGETEGSSQIAAKVGPGIRSRLMLESLNGQADADHGQTVLINEMMDQWLAKS